MYRMDSDFYIIAESHKSLNKAIILMNTNFRNNLNAQRIVNRTLKVINQKDKTKLIKVHYTDLFPAFSTVAGYLLVLGVVFGCCAGIIFNSIPIAVRVLTISLFAPLILVFLDVLRKPKILFYTLRKGLAKHGYKGYVKFGGCYGNY